MAGTPLLSSFLVFAFSSFLLFSILTVPVSSAKCDPNDKKALLRIKQFYHNATIFPSWIPSNGCCNWFGVDCDPATGHVTTLVLQTDSTVSGTIAPAIGDLSHLQELILHKLPNLVGTLIPELSRLSNLTSLFLSWNSLSGPIPSFLSTLKNLNYINLSFNRFTGTIPASLSTLPLLGFLDLSRNQLTGGIPESFGKFGPIFYLHLSHNNLTGTLPRSLGGGGFRDIDVSRNQLSGDASFLFGVSKTELETINLSRNMFEFDLTNVGIPPGLDELDLNHNAIFGSIPKQITEVPTLNQFNVSYNRLCGVIPRGGRFDSYDQSVFIHNRCLCGAPLQPCK